MFRGAPNRVDTVSIFFGRGYFRVKCREGGVRGEEGAMDDRRWVSLSTRQLLHSCSNIYQHKAISSCAATEWRSPIWIGMWGREVERGASLLSATFTHIFTHRHSLAHPHKKAFISRFFFFYRRRHGFKKVLFSFLKS